MSKTLGNNRISALKRINKPSSINNSNRHLLIGSKNSSINDARQILLNKNKTSFDARQLLTRQSSNTLDNVTKNVIGRKNVLQNNEDMVVVTGLKDIKMKDGRIIQNPTNGNTQLEKKKQIFAVGPSTFVTIRNSNTNNISSNQSTEKISLTKTIKNTSVRREDDSRTSQTTATPSSSSNQKVVISFVNDKYQKSLTPSQPTPTPSNSTSPLIHHRNSPPVIKRLHDASIQTISSSSSSRSPIRMNSYRRQDSNTIVNEQDQTTERTIGDDLYEPPIKRTTSSKRKTTTIDKEPPMLSAAISTGSVKRTSTGAPVSSRITSSTSTVSKQAAAVTQSSSTPGVILVTNLQASVSEEDVIELFGEIGRISEITTLSQGCIQIIYAKREYAEQAVTKYHNRLLDGQFMYVSLQQPSVNSKPTSSIQQPAKETGTSANSSSSSTATTTHQPLKFNTSNNSSNKITIDPTFIRQALFHPSNNSTNPVQFQVKL